MLSLVPRAEEVSPEDAVPERLADLTRALELECRLIDDLRTALLRQREGIAADDPAMIEASVHAVGRTLLTMEEARRRRIALTTLLGVGEVSLDELERTLGHLLPADFRAAREAVRRSAEATAREVAINQNILRRAIQAGDAFLQQLFSSVADPMPAYTPGPAAEPRPAAMLLNRTA
jgi:hypothetical protein